MTKVTKVVSLALFFATGMAIGMEVPKLIVQNEAWSYAMGGGYYDIKVSVNDSSEEIQIKGGESQDVGNLSGINQIKVRRSGAGSSWIPSFAGVSTITSEQLNALKQEANENLLSDLVLVIGATTTGYAIYTHFWKQQSLEEAQKPTAKNDPWSVFPQANIVKEKLGVANFFEGKIENPKLVAIAKVVFGFGIRDEPTAAEIKKKYYQLIRQFHPDKAQGLTSSMIFDQFAEQVGQIVTRAYQILTPARDIKFDETWQK